MCIFLELFSSFFFCNAGLVHGHFPRFWSLDFSSDLLVLFYGKKIKPHFLFNPGLILIAFFDQLAPGSYFNNLDGILGLSMHFFFLL